MDGSLSHWFPLSRFEPATAQFMEANAYININKRVELETDYIKFKNYSLFMETNYFIESQELQLLPINMIDDYTITSSSEVCIFFI